MPFQRICAIFGQLSPSCARQLSFKSSQPGPMLMSFREDGKSGKDDMFGHLKILRFFRLEKHFKFVGREIISQSRNIRLLTDAKFVDSSREMNGSLHLSTQRVGGTVEPSAESMLLSSTELLTWSVPWTRNCEIHSGMSFGTSTKRTQ